MGCDGRDARRPRNDEGWVSPGPCCVVESGRITEKWRSGISVPTTEKRTPVRFSSGNRPVLFLPQPTRGPRSRLARAFACLMKRTGVRFSVSLAAVRLIAEKRNPFRFSKKKRFFRFLITERPTESTCACIRPLSEADRSPLLRWLGSGTAHNGEAESFPLQQGK